MRKDFGEDAREGITVRAREEAVGDVVEFVSACAREMAFTEGRIGEIRLALEEALGNIIRFACPADAGEIEVRCAAHETGSIVLTIMDSGKPFNMLAASTFPELAEGTGEVPSTTMMKRLIKDVEYRRDGAGGKNILAWVVSR